MTGDGRSSASVGSLALTHWQRGHPGSQLPQHTRRKVGAEWRGRAGGGDRLDAVLPFGCDKRDGVNALMLLDWGSHLQPFLTSLCKMTAEAGRSVSGEEWCQPLAILGPVRPPSPPSRFPWRPCQLPPRPPHLATNSGALLFLYPPHPNPLLSSRQLPRARTKSRMQVSDLNEVVITGKLWPGWSLVRTGFGLPRVGGGTKDAFAAPT